MTHPDEEGWRTHARSHVEYLHELVEKKSLVASGPVKGFPCRAGFLIFKAQDRAEIESLVASDPFAKQGLIAELSIHEWDPLFGLFAEESGRANITPRGSRAARSKV